MKEIDSLNFVKLDILGLDNIGLIYKTCDAAGIPFATPDNIPADDEAVWQSIKDDTTMIFQWESQSATAYLKQLFSDETIAKIKAVNRNFSYMNLLSIGNGAIRPAGESYRDKLANSEYKLYGNAALDEFMKPTLGYMVYQEQIIEFLNKFCGFTMGEADVVRRHFSKKTGTETDIPIIKNGGNLTESHYIKGFINTMKDDYGVEREESEKIIESFLKVIEDASDYLFSYNHALPYSFIGFAVGYLRHYYPLETYTVALNIYHSNEEKLKAITEYVKSKKVKIEPIKFRYSRAGYTLDKESKTIYKGVSSVKYLSEAVGNKLYELRDKHFDSFVDFLKVNPCDEKQTIILIKLNFFSEFGGIKKLLRILEIYETYGTVSQINKDSPKDLGREIMSQFSKETAKQYRNIRTDELVRYLINGVPEIECTIQEQLEWQKEFLGYVDFIDPKLSKQVLVMDVDDRYSPKLNVYSLSKGGMITMKMKSPLYKKKKIAKGQRIKILKHKKKPAYKKTETGFEVVPDKFDWWIEDCEVIE
jgi:DNA polymerase-3 subunit alpha